MSFEKCKPGGYIIFDDYLLQWKQTIVGIDNFLNDPAKIAELKRVLSEDLK